MQISRQSYFVTQLISQQDTGIAQVHCQSVLQLLHVSQQVIDISAMTGDHRSLGHLVAPTDVNLLAVLLCHTENISARYRHCRSALPISATIITCVLKHRKIALSIRTIIVTDVSARISRQINYHRCLGHLVAPTDVNLLAVLLCHTVNTPARYKHCKIALSIRTIIVTDVSARISRQTNYHRCLGHLVAPTDVNLSAVLLCHTVNTPVRYKHCKI